MPGIDFSAHITNPTAQGPGAAAAAAQTAADSPSFFDDLLDIVNPLQHIPVISTIYRHLTGDKIDTVSKLAGDTLYGGVTGLLCSLGDSLFQEVTGKSVGDTVYAALISDQSDQTTAVASADTPASVIPANSMPEPLHLSFLENDAGIQPLEVAADSTVGNDLPVGLLHASLFEDADTAPTPMAVQRAAMAYRASGKLLEAY